MARYRVARRAAGIALFLLLVRPAVATAQDSVHAAETLYAAAAYDEALAVLDRLQAQGVPAADIRQVQENRALCLLALGRIEDANLAIAAVVTADPLYRPDEASASPRVRAAYHEVRGRLLPGIIESHYHDARALYDNQQWADALKAFHQVVELAADPALDEAQARSVDEYRVLASDFGTLAEKAANRPAPAGGASGEASAPAPPPPVPAPVPVDYSRIFDESDASVVPPVTRRQDLPPWIDRGRPLPRNGTLEIVVTATGVVERATLSQAMSPMFDRQVLEATKNWRYLPAVLDGHQVRYRKVIHITFQ